MTTRVSLEVLNRLGLHARPASEFVRCAQRFQGTIITLHRGGETYSTTSILEVLMANLDQGTTFILEADGPRAEEALQEFAALLIRFRDEEDGEPK